MRYLFLLQGIPGAGKSTWIKKEGLEPYTLSSDDIRLLLSNPVMNEEGKFVINQSVNASTWRVLFNCLEERMKAGAMTIVDATHVTKESVQRYKKLCDDYRYRCFIIRFDTNFETACAQNDGRVEYRAISHKIIENFKGKLDNFTIGNWATIIKPEQFKEVINYNIPDLSHYKAIVHFSDLQGCMEPANDYFKKYPEDPEILYIYHGDLVDRGPQNHLTTKFALERYKRPNWIFIEGNHEKHLHDWAHGKDIKSEEFANFTKAQLEEHNVSKKEVREFCRKLRQMFVYTYHGKTVLCSHAGLSRMPMSTEIIKISSIQYIKGVGMYGFDIDSKFEELSPDVYQVHGHRNAHKTPFEVTQKSFNLEDQVEFGGYLRVLTFRGLEIEVEKFKNDTVRADIQKQRDCELPLVQGSLIDQLRANPMINERPLGNNISSFNFKKEVFFDALWSAQTVKARGLFINTVTGKIVSRSYDKFFNLNEREDTKLEYLRGHLSYPVKVYAKENGFLGIVGYDEESDSLLITSKSTDKSNFANWFKDILTRTANMEALYDHCKNSNCSFVFEVIDPENDPHIIEYTKKEIVLLNIIRRTIDFEKMPDDAAEILAKEIGVPYKTKVAYIVNGHHFEKFVQEIEIASWVDLEGYVLEDSQGFMFKIKTPYYNFWKNMRRYLHRLQRGGSVDERHLDAQGQKFVAFLKTLGPNDLEKSLIELRNIYLSSHNGKIKT